MGRLRVVLSYGSTGNKGMALANGAKKLLSADRDHDRISRVSGLKVELIGD